MSRVVFSRTSPWFPRVVRAGGALMIELGAGADAVHEPRELTFPIAESHLTVIREDLARHLLLWSALIPLWEDAGIYDPLDEAAAVALLDPILLAPPADVDALFVHIRWYVHLLVSHGCDIDLLERGQVCAAMRSATEKSSWYRVDAYVANPGRAKPAMSYPPLDTAIMKFTGRYLPDTNTAYLSRLQVSRRPDEVEPSLLSDVLQVVATAEQACVGMKIGTRQRSWDRMMARASGAVRAEYPELADAAVWDVSYLICSEASDRAQDLVPD